MAEVRIKTPDGNNHVGLSTANLSGDVTVTLPKASIDLSSAGSDGQFLKTDGAGTLSFDSVSDTNDTNSPSWCIERTDAWGMSSGQWLLIPFNLTRWNVGGGTIAAPSNGDTQGASWTCPSGQAGKYFVHANVFICGGQNYLDDGEAVEMKLFKEGTEHKPSHVINYVSKTNGCAGIQSSVCIDIAVGDELQWKIHHDEGGGTLTSTGTLQFSGFKLAGV
jgi:hypothetical protein